MHFDIGILRTRWAAIGAAVAVSLGAGGFGIASATITSGEKPVFIALDEPARILDTRDNTGLTGKFLTDSPRDLQVTGTVPVRNKADQVVVPTTANGVSMSVTVFLPQAAGFLSVRPQGTAGNPQTANVNFAAGSITNNAVNASLPTNGQLQLWLKTGLPGGTADVIVDVLGFYEDHHHGDDAWGYVIGSSGSFHARGGAVRASRLTTGRYCLFVGARGSYKAAQASIANPSAGGKDLHISVGTGHGSSCPAAGADERTVPIYVVDGAGAYKDANFTFYIPPP